MSATETRPSIDARPRFEGAWAADELSNLVENARPIGYGVVQVGQFVEGGIRVLAIKDLGSNYTSGVHRCDPRHEQRFVNKRVRPGDVLISVKGTIGRVGVVPEGYEGNISRELARLSFDDLHSPTFWGFQLLSIESQRLIEHVTVGTTRLELPIGVLKRLKLPYPPLPEQRAIAAALSDVDDLLQSLDRLIAKNRNIKTGAMQQLLTGKTRLPGFEGAWETKRLGDLLSRAPRYGINAPAAQDDGTLPTYIRITDISDTGRYCPAPRVAVRHRNSSEYLLDPGDLVVARTGASVGKTYTCRHEDTPLVFAGFLIQVRPDSDQLEPWYLDAHVRTSNYWAWIKESSTRTGQPGINAQQLSQFELPLPPLPEQRAIAAVLSDMDAEIDALEARRTKTAAIKQGMMQELLTGRTRLPIPQEHSA